MTSVKHLVHQIRSQGEDIPDQKIVEKVLRSLPEKFNMVVVAIEESKDLTTFTID
jgi:chromosome condensin MukBEF MukE localization factor